jgi:hypothetical protein
VHLATVAYVADPAVMRDESDPPRPAAKLGEAKPTGNDGAQSIGTDDDARAMHRSAAGPPRMHADDAASGVPLQIGDMTPLLHPRTCSSRTLKQDGIETLARECEAAVSEAAIPVTRNEVAADPGSVWRAHAHAGELGCTGAFHLLEYAQRSEEA